MARKTIDVETVKLRANRALTDAAPHQNETMGATCAQIFRQGIAVVLEDVLHESGNYRGFQYADPNGQRNERGFLIEGTYDDSIRRYF